MIGIDYIAEFVTLAETLNFGEAARRLYITQPALSRHMMALEKELGVTLLERTTRSVALTEEGRRVLETFALLDREYRQLRKDLASSSDGSAQLTVYAPSYWMRVYIEPTALSASWESQPFDALLETRQPLEALQALAEGDCDLFFGSGMIGDLDHHLAMELLTAEPFVAFVAADDPLACRAGVQASDLADKPLVLLTHTLSGYEVINSAIEDIFTSSDVAINETIYVSQPEAMRVTIISKHAVCIAPISLADTFSDGIVAVPLDEGRHRMPLCFYYRKRDLSPAAQSFLAAARNVFPAGSAGT